ncbi:MAG: phage holin family protein [Prevotella sp.]|nr:phage holin family protein [Prevotella sp.]
MLSSDKNVETLAQLVETVKSYLSLQGEYLKLNVIDKMVRLVTALTLTIVFVILGVAVLFYLSFALVYWLEPLTGTALAFFIMAMLFLALLVLVFIFRKSWIERPLVRFLADLLMS